VLAVLSSELNKAYEVTEKILVGINTIRKSGQTNMADIVTVQYLADKMNNYSLVIWLHEHKHHYTNVLEEVDWDQVEVNDGCLYMISRI